MVFANKFTPEALKVLAFGSISGSYAAIGTPTANAWDECIINNTTDQDITVSFDGTNDHVRLGANQIVKLSEGSLSMIRINGKLEAGTQFYAKQSTATAPTKNAIIVMGFYFK